MPVFERIGKKGKIDRPATNWTGPCGDGPNGGITFSLISRFLQCRERFRIHTVLGLKPDGGFNHRIEYGSMWHVCEEAFARGMDFLPPLTTYCRNLCQTYRTQQNEVDKWFNVCKVQFPEYVKFWKKHPDTISRTSVYAEQVFDVPYKLPSGRVVRLRGKWDGVDDLHGEVTKGKWLFETKTKGDVNVEQIVRQLTFDLQTMLYVVALETHLDLTGSSVGSGKTGGQGRGVGTLHEPFGRHRDNESISGRVRGVRFNVVRRPLSGGKGTIVRKKATKNHPEESEPEYYARLAQYIKDEPDTYFFRFNVDVTPKDVETFRVQCLDPVLETLCDWWDLVRINPDPWKPSRGIPVAQVRTWRHPFGVRNILDEGGSSDLDEFLANGSTSGLKKIDDLFPELS